MRIVFVDGSDLKFDITSIDTEPLGGSQSAMFIVAEHIANSGHEVSIAARHFSSGFSRRGISGIQLKDAMAGAIPGADIVITLNFLLGPLDLRSAFGRSALYIHWHQNDVFSPYGRKFSNPEFYRHVDHFIFASHWQANTFIGKYGLPCSRVTVIANPVSPHFVGLLPDSAPILAFKDPNLLYYASAPHRGLELLLTKVFPAIKANRPMLRLEVYSGFYLNQGMDFKDLANIEKIIQMCKDSPGVDFCHGLPKVEFAERVKSAVMLCYPCSFRETSCMVALEAMAAGCQLSVTAAGGIPETTAGHAKLTPISMMPGDDRRFIYDVSTFVANTLHLLDERERNPQGVENNLRRQVDHVTACHAPAVIGSGWERTLRCLAGN